MFLCSQLYGSLKPVAEKWREFGHACGVSEEKLAKIEPPYEKTMFKKVLEILIQKDEPFVFSKMSVYETLKSSAVGLSIFAKGWRSKYMPSG